MYSAPIVPVISLDPAWHEDALAVCWRGWKNVRSAAFFFQTFEHYSRLIWSFLVCVGKGPEDFVENWESESGGKVHAGGKQMAAAFPLQPLIKERMVSYRIILLDFLYACFPSLCAVGTQSSSWLALTEAPLYYYLYMYTIHILCYPHAWALHVLWTKACSGGLG